MRGGGRVACQWEVVVRLVVAGRRGGKMTGGRNGVEVKVERPGGRGENRKDGEHLL